jgi:hypothetical protein
VFYVFKTVWYLDFTNKLIQAVSLNHLFMLLPILFSLSLLILLLQQLSCLENAPYLLINYKIN